MAAGLRAPWRPRARLTPKAQKPKMMMMKSTTSARNMKAYTSVAARYLVCRMSWKKHRRGRYTLWALRACGRGLSSVPPCVLPPAPLLGHSQASHSQGQAEGLQLDPESLDSFPGAAPPLLSLRGGCCLVLVLGVSVCGGSATIDRRPQGAGPRLAPDHSESPLRGCHHPISQNSRRA